MINNWENIVFDCDGVILQSNKIKSEGFSAVLYGHDAELVDEFVRWHKSRGGVSRFEKFEYFFKEMAQVADWKERSRAAATQFGELIRTQMNDCAYVPGFLPFLQNLSNLGIHASVNTGGAESEIRSIFHYRGILKNFSHVFGSPTSKFENMSKLRNLGVIKEGSVYFGDSQLDFQLSNEFDIPFVFVSYESEWADGTDCVRDAGGLIIGDFNELSPLEKQPA